MKRKKKMRLRKRKWRRKINGNKKQQTLLDMELLAQAELLETRKNISLPYLFLLVLDTKPFNTVQGAGVQRPGFVSLVHRLISSYELPLLHF